MEKMKNNIFKKVRKLQNSLLLLRREDLDKSIYKLFKKALKAR